MNLKPFFRDQYKDHRLLPDVLDRLTPHQFALVFFADPAADAAPSQVELLRTANDLRAAKGLPPVAPAWLVGSKKARKPKPAVNRRPKGA